VLVEDREHFFVELSSGFAAESLEEKISKAGLNNNKR